MPLGDKGMAAMLMARRGAPDFEAPLLGEDKLDETEAGVLERARHVLASGHENFLARFWDLVPQAGERQASCTLKNGLHSGNRVGHTQGGIVLALAGHTCGSAVGEDWDLASISGWYLSPGRGQALHANAAILHRGSSTASCLCEIKDDEGRLVMHAVSSHVRRGATPGGR
jgi:acyl-coenzyme A thioesterase PaaI-like protein